MLHAKKGFISAPLIGTVIFLASILFVVNLQNVEAQTSLRIANDAYHNRIASVLEQHRSDLASIFREGLSRTISFYLLNPGWDAFKWDNNPALTYYSSDGKFSNRGLEQDPYIDGSLGGGADGRISLAELKYAKCDTVRTLTSDFICSLPDTNVGENVEYKYGLPQWMSKFVDNNGTFVFEGITFNTSNPDQVKVFLPASRQDVSQQQAVREYYQYCNALLRGSVFDCRTFATQTDPATGGSKMQCYDYDVNNNGVPNEGPEDVRKLEGCEDGRFFVKVNLENAIDGIEVYPKLPRVEAKDTGGNLFRSSGIGEKNFYLPINLRIFKYFDETFKVYKHLAYGSMGNGEGSRNGIETRMELEGVADGNCGSAIGNDNNNRCDDSDSGFNDQGYALPNDIRPPDDEKITKAVGKNYFDFVFKPACREPVGLQSQSMELRFCTTTNCDLANAPICNDALDYTPLESANLFNTQLCEHNGEGVRGCAFFPPSTWNFLLTDNKPAFRIDPQNPVNFKWGVSLQHDTA